MYSSSFQYTIIIPHYNTPDLLMRCLRSIPVQENIQVIIVDDCSPDAEEYFNRYSELSRPFLEFYSTPEGGSAGRARNVGIKHALGEWLVFMDADDLFVDNMYNLLIEYSDNNADILFYNYKTVLNSNLKIEGHRGDYQKLFSQYNIDGKEDSFRYHYDPLWGKVIKRTLVEQHSIRCDETRYGNDVSFSFKCGVFARSIKIIDIPLFIITERDGSLASSQFNNKKRGIEEYKSRLQGALNLYQFILDNKLNINNKMYITLSFMFVKDHPRAFISYFFKYILMKHPSIALRIPAYLIYLCVLNRN